MTPEVDDRTTDHRATLEQIVAGKLPQRVIDAIAAMDLTMGELVQWEASKPAMRFTVRDGRLIIEMHARIPVRKFLAMLGGLGVFVWALSSFMLPYLPAP